MFILVTVQFICFLVKYKQNLFYDSNIFKKQDYKMRYKKINIIYINKIILKK